MKIKPYYYERALKIPFYNLYHLRRIKSICLFLPKNKDTLIDIGCADGTLTKFMKDFSKTKKVIGFDINKDFIKYAKRKRPDIEFYVSDGRNLPVKNNSADIVTLIEVLEHLENPEEMIIEAKRILKNNGFLLIVVPNEDSKIFKFLWFVWSKFFGKIWKDDHKFRFNENTLIKILEKNNFYILKIVKINFGMLLLCISKKLNISSC